MLRLSSGEARGDLEPVIWQGNALFKTASLNV